MSEKLGILKLIKVYISIVVLVGAYILPRYVNFPILQNDLYLIAWFIGGCSVVAKCLCNIFRREFIDENLLMTVSTIGAMCLGDFAEAALVMVLYSAGEYLQDRAIFRSKKSINELVNVRPLYANVERNDKLEKVKPEAVKTGEIIVIKAGERIPLDGTIIAGQSSVDISSVTGESVPRDYEQNDYVLSGCINLTGVLRVKVDKPYSESTVSRFMKLVENARKNKSHTERLMTGFAKIYTPAVLTLAAFIVIVPFSMYIYANGFSNCLPFMKLYIERALIFLVISCPCAFVLSVPLTFFSGIGIASRFGLLIKGENCIETLDNVNIAVFDKTGTLTTGHQKVSKVVLAPDVTRGDFRESVLAVEAGSNHPIALAVKRAFGYKESKSIIERDDNIREIPGKGMWLKRGATEIIVGNKELMNEYKVKIKINKNAYAGTLVYVAKNKEYIGAIVITDDLKQSAKMVISQLRGLNIKSMMLTGDVKESAAATANFLGMDNWYYGLMPENKVYRIEEIMNRNISGKKVLYVGDGINDAPVITRADVGVAMGAIGSEAAIAAADVVVADDNLTKIFLLFNIARKTMRIAKQNIAIAIGVKLLFLLLCAFGYMSMWMAVFADTGVALLTILNTLRILNIFDYKFD